MAVNHVYIALYLICHHGNPDEVLKDAQLTQRVTAEKHVPVTYFFSGIELNAILENRDRIRHETGIDLVDVIKGGLFINPRYGYNSPYLSELGIMPFHHMPLVQPWGQDLWGRYFEDFLKGNIQWSQHLAQYHFDRIPVTMHPPDGIYAPAAAHTLRSVGLDTVVVSSEFLGQNRKAKGFLYWASGLRHLVRTNDIQPQSSDFTYAERFVEAVKAYAFGNDIEFIVVGCDIDEFNGMRQMSLEEGVARLCCIGDVAFSDPCTSMVNCNAAAYLNPCQNNIEGIWPWNEVHAMIHGDGNLRWIDAERNSLIGYLIWLVGIRQKQGWDVARAKEYISTASDIALRNANFCYDLWLSRYFDENIEAAKKLLSG